MAWNPKWRSILYGNKATYTNNAQDTFLSKYPEQYKYLLPSENLLNKPDPEYTGRGRVRAVKIEQLSQKDTNQMLNELNAALETGDVVKIIQPPDYIPHLQGYTLPSHVINNDTLMLFFNEKNRIDLILPDAFNCVYLYLNPLATKKQCLDSLLIGIEYLTIIINRNDQPHLFDEYKELLQNLKMVFKKLMPINDTEFSQEYHPDIEEKSTLLSLMNTALIKDNRSTYMVIVNVLTEFYESSDPDIGLKHINNLHTLKREKGGKDNKHMIYKSITDVPEKN